jgi:hypothetical protein
MELLSRFALLTYVSQGEADAIQAAKGQLVPSLGTAGQQLGPGTYLGQTYKAWDASHPYKFDCLVFVEKVAFMAIQKAWVPKQTTVATDNPDQAPQCDQLWWEGSGE